MMAWFVGVAVVAILAGLVVYTWVEVSDFADFMEEMDEEELYH